MSEKLLYHAVWNWLIQKLSEKVSRDNHYVPVWYQRNFLLDGQNRYFYHNLSPETQTLPNGNTITLKTVRELGPKKCFVLQDLYTTHFLGIPNDEIERYLFGKIDQYGKKAIGAFVHQDFNTLHKYFIKVFEYLDAQKLRTPKGLDWLKLKYAALSQIQLMYEMQNVRKMHCTMWVEAVREIVSAEESTVKFIVSDHPVTIYNPSCSPDHPLCVYPSDPSIAFKASQTMFPLDLNHCLILTNLEYAKNPETCKHLDLRTNARYFGETIARFDTVIKDRKLKERDVHIINYIIKSRAKKYIAAAKEEWLYPEKHLVGSAWPDFAATLLPKDGLWHFGGEIYVGGKDGGLAHYQDSFGRTLGELKHLQKPVRQKVRPNELCTCGSGKKYKKCCRNKSIEERPTSSEFSIRERNILFFNAVIKILKLDQDKNWTNVRRELSGDQVKKIYEVYGSLWPKETDLNKLLPSPDSSVTRALYTGLIDPRVMLRNVAGFSLYVDEVILISPFMNPVNVQPDYNPIQNPDQYKQETIKNVLLLFELMPFIDAGFINMIPCPFDFNPGLRQQIYEMAKQRTKGKTLDKKHVESMQPFYEEDFIRSLWSMSDKVIIGQLRKSGQKLTEEEEKKTLEYIKRKQEADPLALLQQNIGRDAGESKKNGQLLVSHMNPNFELGLYLSQLVGAFLYTDNNLRWDEFGQALTLKSSRCAKLQDSIEQMYFPLPNSLRPDVVLRIKKEGKFGVMRSVLRRIWYLAMENKEFAEDVVIDEIKKAYKIMTNEWNAWQKQFKEDVSFLPTVNGKLSFRIPIGGISLNEVYRLLAIHTVERRYTKNVPMVLKITVDADQKVEAEKC